VPHPGRRRAATRLACAAVGVILATGLSACGTPAHLDHQEQVAFARECASLVERNVAENAPPRKVQVGDETLTLDQPPSFYSRLERLRGASTYNLHDPKHDADTARQPLDDCNPKTPAASSVSKPKTDSATTTSSTTTTTTSPVPGS